MTNASPGLRPGCEILFVDRLVFGKVLFFDLKRHARRLSLTQW
jgi:hypothetical protein